MTRAYCRCAVIQNYDYDKAAAKLGCKRRWLEDRISRLPHLKLGEKTAFCECHLALIQRMCEVIPANVEALLTDAAPKTEEPPAVPAIRAIRPAKGRTRATAGV